MRVVFVLGGKGNCQVTQKQDPLEKFEGNQSYWHLGFGCLHTFTGPGSVTLGRGRGTEDKKVNRDSLDPLHLLLQLCVHPGCGK